MVDEVIYFIMIFIMSSMMLFFIKVEKNRMIFIISMEFMNVLIMMDRNLDKVNILVVIVFVFVSMIKVIFKLVFELIFSMEGLVKGLLNVVCNISFDVVSVIL